MTLAETDAKLLKLNSDFHKLSERLTEHAASETSCRETVQALVRSHWGNGKPGVEANVANIRTDVEVIKVYVEEIQRKQADQERQREEDRRANKRFFYTVAGGCIVSALSGIGSIVVQVVTQSMRIQGTDAAGETINNMMILLKYIMA